MFLCDPLLLQAYLYVAHKCLCHCDVVKMYHHPLLHMLLFGVSSATFVTVQCPRCPHAAATQTRQPDSFQGPLFPGCYYTAPWIPNCVIQCDEACSDAHSQPTGAKMMQKSGWEREKQCGPLIRSTDIVWSFRSQQVSAIAFPGVAAA